MRQASANGQYVYGTSHASLTSALLAQLLVKIAISGSRVLRANMLRDILSSIVYGLDEFYQFPGGWMIVRNLFSKQDGRLVEPIQGMPRSRSLSAGDFAHLQGHGL